MPAPRPRQNQATPLQNGPSDYSLPPSIQQETPRRTSSAISHERPFDEQRRSEFSAATYRSDNVERAQPGEGFEGAANGLHEDATAAALERPDEIKLNHHASSTSHHTPHQLSEAELVVSLPLNGADNGDTPSQPACMIAPFQPTPGKLWREGIFEDVQQLSGTCTGGWPPDERDPEGGLDPLVGLSKQEMETAAQVLHHRLLQWEFVNAKAAGAGAAGRAMAEVGSNTSGPEVVIKRSCLLLSAESIDLHRLHDLYLKGAYCVVASTCPLDP